MEQDSKRKLKPRPRGGVFFIQGLKNLIEIFSYIQNIIFYSSSILDRLYPTAYSGLQAKFQTFRITVGKSDTQNSFLFINLWLPLSETERVVITFNIK